jgi:hypothetical protein
MINMQPTRKHTAWKKNRKLGDVQGGRKRPKLSDGIFKRRHNLKALAPGQERPVFIVDNPSRDFYFPVTAGEVKETLAKLPVEHTAFLTHIWLCKVSKKDYENGNTIQGEFICGSGVYLIRLYAFPKDNKMLFGQSKPTHKQLNFYKTYCTDLRQDKKGWYLQWEPEKIRDYFLQKLLMHEIGHCVDYVYHHRWSKANNKQVEDFADNYAVAWSNRLKETNE